MIARPDQPSITDAVERLVHAGEDMIAKRIDLAVLEGKAISQRVLLAAGFGVCGFAVFCTAWVALVYALVAALLPDSPPFMRAGLFGVINLTVAAILIFSAVHFGRTLNPAADQHSNHDGKHGH